LSCRLRTEQLHIGYGKRTIVMVAHDLNHAALYAGHAIAIRQGRIARQGPPAAVTTPGMLREMSGVEADVR